MKEKEMEIFTDIMRKCGVNTEKHTWSELEDMAKAMEAYHEHKLKLLGIADVVGQSEQLICDTCKSGLIDYPEINRRTCCCGGLGYNVTD